MSTDAQRPVRGFVAGLGYLGVMHLRVLGQIPDVHVVVGVDVNPERRRALTRWHRGDVASLDEALAAEHSVPRVPRNPCCNASAAHAPAPQAAEPVMVEKPLAADEEGALALALEAGRSGVLTGVGHV